MTIINKILHLYSTRGLRALIRGVRHFVFNYWAPDLYELNRSRAKNSVHSNFRCRVANVDDVIGISKVYDCDLMGEKYCAKQMKDIVMNMLSSCEKCYVVESRALIVSVIFVRNVFVWFGDPSYELYKVAVLPNYRGMGVVGIGISKVASDYQKVRLFSRISSDNASSIRAFSKAGFVCIGKIRAFTVFGKIWYSFVSYSLS